MLSWEFPHGLVTGGQVSRVDPESMGLNPVWRNSLVYTTLGTAWQEGTNSTEIEAGRKVLIQEMKIIEGITPESGAYLNEVRFFKNSQCLDHTYCILNASSGSKYEFDWKKSFFGTLWQAPSHQAEIRSSITLPRLRRYCIGRVGSPNAYFALEPGQQFCCGQRVFPTSVPRTPTSAAQSLTHRPERTSLCLLLAIHTRRFTLGLRTTNRFLGVHRTRVLGRLWCLWCDVGWGRAGLVSFFQLQRQ